ncbi:unnamed protein product [Lampetra planeri]
MGPYRFRSRDGSYVVLRSQWFSFLNPWTKDVEYIVSTNTLVSSPNTGAQICTDGGGGQHREDKTRELLKYVPGLPGGTRLGAGKLGRTIAEEFFESRSRLVSPWVSRSIVRCVRMCGCSGCDRLHPVATAVPCSQTPGRRLPPTRRRPATRSLRTLLSCCCDTDSLDLDLMNNPGSPDDDVAMSVIINLLEADGGLGGPVDFSDMPWPL